MSNNDNLHKNHRMRLKQRFKEIGLASFAPHEILELLLFYAIPRKDTNKIGHMLIKNFSSLSQVFDAPLDELLSIPGISENSALLIKLIPELSRAYNVDKTSGIRYISNYEDGGNYLVSRFIGVTVEQVIMICLDNSDRILDCIILHEGSVNSVFISPRKIAQAALQKRASSIILAHNHPAGVAIPSSEDLNTTRAIQRLCDLLEIRFREHYIVAQDTYTGILHEIDL